MLEINVALAVPLLDQMARAAAAILHPVWYTPCQTNMEHLLLSLCQAHYMKRAEECVHKQQRHRLA